MLYIRCLIVFSLLHFLELIFMMLGPNSKSKEFKEGGLGFAIATAWINLAKVVGEMRELLSVIFSQSCFFGPVGPLLWNILGLAFYMRHRQHDIV